MSLLHPTQARELADACLVHVRSAQAALRFEALLRGTADASRDTVRDVLHLVSRLSEAEARLLDVWDSPRPELPACLRDAARLCDEALELLVAEQDDLWEPEGAAANLRRVGDLLATTPPDEGATPKEVPGAR